MGIPDFAIDLPALNRKTKLELLVLAVLSLPVYALAARNDLLESLTEFAWRHEHWEIDEIIVLGLYGTLAFLFFAIRRWLELRTANNLLGAQNRELQKAMSEIKQLRGIIPICASCKRIRDDEGYWHKVEAYIHEHSEAVFSHCICPKCMQKLYPEYVT